MKISKKVLKRVDNKTLFQLLKPTLEAGGLKQYDQWNVKTKGILAAIEYNLLRLILLES